MRSQHLILLGLVSFSVFGCRPERAPSRRELKQERAARAAEKDQTLTPKPLPAPQVDDANLVIAKCGRAEIDAVLPIYNKVQNGPVRRMMYRQREMVTIDFIPSTPIGHKTDVPAPFPRPKVMIAALPSGSVWRFDEARVDEHEMLTSKRLAVYLPCAASALSKED